jgi:hypothetical protein
MFFNRQKIRFVKLPDILQALSLVYGFKNTEVGRAALTILSSFKNNFYYTQDAVISCKSFYCLL